MNKKEQTIAAYNATADAIADKFNAMGARISDIDEAFTRVEKTNPNVLEIGCGNGRDAKGILRRTTNYLGVDISEKLIDLARKLNPDGRFEVADIEEFTLPRNLDIIFAFASLLHVPRESLRNILAEAFEALNPGGVFFISLKHSDKYEEQTKTDQFGTRTFYFYSEKDLDELKGEFKTVWKKVHEVRGQVWIDMILQK
jgi:SAM-dependent methyltransferase